MNGREQDDHIAIALSWGGNVYREQFDQAIFHGKLSGLDTLCGHWILIIDKQMIIIWVATDTSTELPTFAACNFLYTNRGDI